MVGRFAAGSNGGWASVIIGIYVMPRLRSFSSQNSSPRISRHLVASSPQSGVGEMEAEVKPLLCNAQQYGAFSAAPRPLSYFFVGIFSPRTFVHEIEMPLLTSVKQRPLIISFSIAPLTSWICPFWTALSLAMSATLMSLTVAKVPITVQCRSAPVSHKPA